MITKKKVVVRKKSAPVKKAAPAVKPKAVPVTPVRDVFQAVEEAARTVEVPRNSVLLYVNGREKGTFETSGMKLVQFVKERAQEYGIRSFSVYADGMKLSDDPATGKLALGKISKLEIVAKDARG